MILDSPDPPPLLVDIILAIKTKGRQGTLAIFNEKYPGFFNICRWAISADTVSENNKFFIEMVLLT